MKTVKRVWNCITTVLVALVVIAALLMVGARLIGLRVFSVISGSMEPTYHVGSLIYVKEMPAEEMKVGDPVTFVLNEDLIVATHRIVEVDTEKQQFFTKGDNNDSVDARPVIFKNVIGKPVFTIPYLGYVSDYVQNPPGLYVTIAGGAALLLLVFLPDLIFGEEKKKKIGENAEAESASEGTAPDEEN